MAVTMKDGSKGQKCLNEGEFSKHRTKAPTTYSEQEGRTGIRAQAGSLILHDV
jgi:hypothetical protein